MTWGRAKDWTVWAAVALGVNSAYLAARYDPTVVYFANVVAASRCSGLALVVGSADPPPRRAFRDLRPASKAARSAARLAAALFGRRAGGERARRGRGVAALGAHARPRPAPGPARR